MPEVTELCVLMFEQICLSPFLAGQGFLWANSCGHETSVVCYALWCTSYTDSFFSDGDFSYVIIFCSFFVLHYQLTCLIHVFDTALW